METIGQCIINRHHLSVEQANKVYNDLIKLETIGVWDLPEWAVELSLHYGGIGEAHAVIQLEGWKAIAQAYRVKLEIV